jgi:hypothetical protein
MSSMRRQWRQLAGQGALFALLLQLALPFLTVQQAIARPGFDAPFVICTSAGLLWINPDGTPAKGATRGGDQDDTAAHHCPICFAKQLAASALLPVVPPLLLAEPIGAVVATGSAAASRIASSAPPLPARGPPFGG